MNDKGKLNWQSLSTWNIFIYYIEKKFFHLPVDGHDGAQSRVFYQRPGRLRNIFVPNSALFYIEISDVLPEICQRHFSNLSITVPSASMDLL